MRLVEQLDDPADPQVLVVVDQRQANVLGANGRRPGQLVAKCKVYPAMQAFANLKFDLSAIESFVGKLLYYTLMYSVFCNLEIVISLEN